MQRENLKSTGSRLCGVSDRRVRRPRASTHKDPANNSIKG